MTPKLFLRIPRFLLLFLAGAILLLPMTVSANEFPPTDWTPTDTFVFDDDEVSADFAPWCPATGALCRVNRDWTIEELQEQLNGHQTAVWRDGDTLNFAYKGRVDDVMLMGGISTSLIPVGNSDYWIATLRIKDLRRAMITYGFYELRGDRLSLVPDSTGIWRGPRAPEYPEVSYPLDGYIFSTFLYSPALDETRQVTVYFPPNYERGQEYPVIYMPFGQAVHSYAQVAEPLIKDGTIPPMLIVGAHSAPFESTRVRYIEEYVLGRNDEAYDAHEQFFTQELRRWAELSWGASEDPANRALFGFNYGAVFAGNTGVRQPDLYGHVMMFSAWNRPTVHARSRIEADYYLLAGTLETPVYNEMQKAYFTLLLLGANSSFNQRVAGHDGLMWQSEFPNALRWLFAEE